MLYRPGELLTGVIHCSYVKPAKLNANIYAVNMPRMSTCSRVVLPKIGRAASGSNELRIDEENALASRVIDDLPELMPPGTRPSGRAGAQTLLPTVHNSRIPSSIDQKMPEYRILRSCEP